MKTPLTWTTCLLIMAVFGAVRCIAGTYTVIASKEDGMNWVYSVTPNDTAIHGYDFLTLQQLDTVLSGGMLCKN